MADFETIETGTTKTAYAISDDNGNTAELTPQQAYDLLHWLYDRRDEIIRLVHPERADQSIPAWLGDLPDWVKADPPEHEPKQRLDPRLSYP